MYLVHPPCLHDVRRRYVGFTHPVRHDTFLRSTYIIGSSRHAGVRAGPQLTQHPSRTHELSWHRLRRLSCHAKVREEGVYAAPRNAQGSIVMSGRQVEADPEPEVPIIEPGSCFGVYCSASLPNHQKRGVFFLGVPAILERSRLTCYLLL